MAHFIELLLEKRTNKGRRVPALIALMLIASLLLLCILLNLQGFAEKLSELGSYLRLRFIQRALLVGVPVSMCAALLGVTLVLKRYSMIGDGLSHVGFGALSIASALGFVTASSLPSFLPEGFRQWLAKLCGLIAGNPLPFTLAVVIALAFWILKMSSKSGMRGDAAIALLSTTALAVGVLVSSSGSGTNVDIMNYMFGSILAMSEADVVLSLALSAVVLVLYVLFCNRIFAVTFDESFARATGTRVDLFNMLISILTAVTIVVGMRMMGTMLISSLIIFPALTSMRLFSNFRKVLISSAVVSVVCFVMGIMLSCLYEIPAGAAIVLVNLAAFLLFSLIARVKG